MLQHTRTKLIELKNSISTVENSISILNTKRAALIGELMKITRLYYDKKEIIKDKYAKALSQLDKSRRLDGSGFFDSALQSAIREIEFEVKSYNLWGVPIKEVRIPGSVIPETNKRNLGFLTSSTFFEKTVQDFESLVNELLDNINYEYKIKRLSAEVVKINRRINVLEQKILPGIKSDIKNIQQHLSERERAEFIKLKYFKNVLRER
ncbi:MULTISPECIES: V-type ATP synthase subunit D [Flexistipes]|uniref:V-type ATPase, D subunit n=1 Tax=Flexistipes sinusarabici (strain ATCC 49648 / DSM 4947 / MAS 10) TaxID=717231 RepID=F8E6W5_FLESM|nr:MULTISPECIES: V-type ATP synthase subunit D [Flexistipes]AEI13751.1 V-type ATPase, D subunit [Flexistipes sinusarabici DSM 4947]MEC9491336.1 V-type ATP synthase subunit D [Flexistipes sp.]